MLEPFLVRAFLGGIGVAIVAGPLGCFVVWRRMAYFGDSLAHSALLGVSLGTLLGIDTNIGVIIAFLMFALLLVFFERQQYLSIDTILGILAHTALSIGLVALSFQNTPQFNLLGFLFGDILSIAWKDIWWIYLGGLIALIVLIYLWAPLLTITVNPELAMAEGIPVARIQFIFILLMALVTVIAMKVVGILLISSLLIIPSSTARQLSRSPEQMAFLAALIGFVAVLGGLVLSVFWDTPSGPSIVLIAALIFGLTHLGNFTRMRFGRGG